MTGSLECEDTPYALPWWGKGASGHVEAADRGSAECGGCSRPRLSSRFCAERWGSCWKQAGLIPQSALKADPWLTCGQRWRGHGYTGKSGRGAFWCRVGDGKGLEGLGHTGDAFR